MDNRRYVALAMVTAPTGMDKDKELLHAGMGLCTEAGEFLDALKKNIFYGKELDEVNLKEEIGDLLWYIALGCNALGTTIDECQAVNIDKLRERYPEGFKKGDALNRDLNVERKILEGGW